ncbi:unnamed protein product [Cyclocybe aegerita]|uniref:Uncharacterized protein n=1 Tax=Cyclocybe aegerita TaxID=1973307 RepID=A0A8S0WZX5_CYCAE|nr:unnamed protein product [Cyclocybe aegerita]
MGYKSRTSRLGTVGRQLTLQKRPCRRAHAKLFSVSWITRIIYSMPWLFTSLPDTYQKAKELALELLRKYLNVPGVLASDIYLKYGIKHKARTDWAYLPPRLYTQVVSGNWEELRIYHKDGRQVDKDEEAKKGQAGCVVIFRLGDTARTPPRGAGSRYAVYTLPETYAEAKEVALRGLWRFMKKKDATVADITLRAVVKNQEDEWVAAVLPIGQGWKDTVIELTRKYQNLEILVLELNT